MIHCKSYLPEEVHSNFPVKITGHVVVHGCVNEIMTEYRALTNIILKEMGPDAILNATLGVIHDDMSGYTIDIIITDKENKQ